MAILIIVVFVLGYAAIAFEHPLKIDKAASALVTGMLCWAIYVFSLGGGHEATEIIEFGKDYVNGGHHVGGLYHHLFDIANILFFLMGAMTIVELVDAHEGFAVITNRIKTKDITKLLWIICILTFFFSAALDNLTTTIVMISLLRKLIKDQKTRWMFVGMVVIAA
ncbi:MAG: SLC13 family permease, partial [Bacteroidia bacterium]